MKLCDVCGKEADVLCKTSTVPDAPEPFVHEHPLCVYCLGTVHSQALKEGLQTDWEPLESCDSETSG